MEVFFLQKFFWGFFGLAWGSYLSNLWLRSQGQTLLFPSLYPLFSQCAHCKKKLGFIENVPLFSYIFLGGRCKGCKAPIGRQSFWIEAFTFLVFLLVGFFYQETWTKQLWVLWGSSCFCLQLGFLAKKQKPPGELGVLWLGFALFGLLWKGV